MLSIGSEVSGTKLGRVDYSPIPHNLQLGELKEVTTFMFQNLMLKKIIVTNRLLYYVRVKIKGLM